MIRKYFFLSVVLLVGLVSLVPMVSGLPGVSIGVIVSSSIIITSLFAPQLIINKATMWFLVYFSYYIVSYYFKGFNLRSNFVTFVMWFSALCLVNVLMSLRDVFSFKLIAWVCICMVVLTSFVTSKELLYDVNVVRTGGGEWSSNTRLAGYGFAHSVTAILPVLVCLIKSKSTRIYHRVILLGVLGAILFFIIKANFGVVLIVSAFVVPVSFAMTSRKDLNIALIVSMLLILTLFLNDKFLINSLEYIKPFFDQTPIEVKLTDIQDSIFYGSTEGAVEGRGELYTASWQAFLSSPIFGLGRKGDMYVGGHSFFLDALAIGGIIGFIPLILFLYYAFKNVYDKIPRECGIYYLLSVLLFIMISAVKATVGGPGLFLWTVVAFSLCFINVTERKRFFPHKGFRNPGMLDEMQGVRGKVPFNSRY